MAGKVKTFLLCNIKPAIALISGALLFSPTIFASPKLEALDDLKVINISEFVTQLADIEKGFESYSSEDKEYIQLLQGYRFSLTLDYASAETHLQKLVNEIKDESILIRVKALLVNIYVVTQEYQSAFLYLDEISRALPSKINNRAREHVLSVMAYTYNQLEQYETSKFYSQLLIDTGLTERVKCHGKYHFLDSLYGLKEWNSFNDIAEDSYQYCRDINELVFAHSIRIKKLEFLLQNAMLDEAKGYFAFIKDDVEKVGYPIFDSWLYSIAAQTELKNGNIVTAELFAINALTNLNESNFTVPLQNTYFVLYKVNEHKNNFADAFRYYKLYSEAKQAISDNRFEQQQAYYAVRAEVEVKNQRIALLDKDNELLFLQKNVIEEEAKQTRVLMAVLAIVLIVFVFLAYKGLTGRRRFKKIAEFDQLTGISNRYHFNNQAALALDYCEKNKQPAAVVLFDLDHFKQINDNYGHAIGDWVLQAVVATCRNFMRNNDVFGRIGGEEFAVVLPGCQTEKAIMLAEICRDAIAAIDTEQSGLSFKLTASFGVSGSDNSGYQLKQLLADADSAMYRAKAGGRDQVAGFSEA